jgi:hypothetical protein
MRRIPLVAALCAAFAACATPAPPPKPAPPPVPLDGTYRGTTTRFQSDVRTCPHPGLVLLVVQDGRFQFHWSYGVYVDSSVAGDGTIQGFGPNISLTGKRNGTHMEGDVTNGTCGLHFTVEKADH